jgi:hypothetical protein
MPVVATVLVGDTHVRIFCLDVRRDPILPANVQLIACKSLSVEDEEGNEFDTDLWSIPASTLVSYATGNRAAPVVAPEPEQAAATPLLGDITDEQREAVRRRREELRELDRQQLADLRARTNAERKAPVEVSYGEPSDAAEEATSPVEDAAPPVPPKSRRRKARASKVG